MSDPKDTTPLKLPAEKPSEEIKEPTDPDEEDDSDGEPDQPDGEK